MQALVVTVPERYSDARWQESNFTTAGVLSAVESPASSGPWGRWVTDGATAFSPVRDNENGGQLANLQWLDEQPLGTQGITEATNVFNHWRVNYRGAIGYGSQVPIVIMQSYLASARPDFDTYPFIGGHDPTEYRPTPYAMYLQTFAVDNHTVSESEIRLNQFGAWAFGYKLATAFYYARSCRFLTQEVNAAIESAVACGVGDILVFDGHGAGAVLIEYLHPAAQLFHGRPRAIHQCRDTLERYEAHAMIGQHAMSGVVTSNQGHTQTPLIVELNLNGRPIGEIAQYALYLGALHRPLIFVSGEQDACREAEVLIPNLSTASVKQGIGRITRFD